MWRKVPWNGFCDEEGILSESSQFLELREARPFFRFSIVLTFTMTLIPFRFHIPDIVSVTKLGAGCKVSVPRLII